MLGDTPTLVSLPVKSPQDYLKTMGDHLQTLECRGRDSIGIYFADPVIARLVGVARAAKEANDPLLLVHIE